MTCIHTLKRKLNLFYATPVYKSLRFESSLAFSIEQACLRAQREQKGGKYCVCGDPGLRSCTNTYHVEGISMHKFPENEEQRKIWIKFVQRHRPNFFPSSSSVICSAHFEKSCFATGYQLGVPDELKPKARYLIQGSVPTKDTVILEEMPSTSRAKRRVRCTS